MEIENNEKYKESESVVLNLEILSAKYDNLLIQYKQAVANYINFLNNDNKSAKVFTDISGQAFWGTGQAGTQAAYTDINSVNNCSALCLKTTGCTGATFNPTAYGNPMCWLRTGDGDPIPSKATDYAIVPQEMQLLSNIKSINIQLTAVNNKILNKMNESNSIYSTQSTERSQKSDDLLKNYIQLNAERMKIENMVNEYQNINQAQIDGSIKVSQNYYSFLLLFALSIIVLIILYKFSGPNSSQSNDYFYQQGGDIGINIYYILFVIILLAVFIYYYSSILNYTSSLFSRVISIF
jgi:hypothetical protein